MVPQQQSALRGALEWIILFVIAFAVFICVRTFVAEPYRVPTGSMEPTIEIGDQIFVQKVSVELGQQVQRGDIVVFHNPNATSPHDILVKRVIATGGQTVDLRDGRVIVDGAQIDEPYARGRSEELAEQAPGANVSFPFKVPTGDVWVMGDNRGNSADSRYFGAVSNSELIGVAFFRYWPFARIGTL